MRKDVKLGMALAVILVVLAGGYFLSGKDAGQAIPFGLDEPSRPDGESGGPGGVAEGLASGVVSGEGQRSEPVWSDPGKRGLELFPPQDAFAASEEEGLADAKDWDEPDVTEAVRSSDDWRPVSLTAMREAGAVESASAEGRGEAGGAPETYIIRSGDTLARLAEVYYGSQRHVDFLLKANPHISDARRLAVGTVIRLPTLPELVGESPAVEPGEEASPGDEVTGQRTYVVQPGDTFYGIAARLLGSGARWKEILELNRDVVHGNAKGLQPGQTLRLPARTGTPERP